MSSIARQVFVISDLHLGGVYPDSDTGEAGGRGFRICTRPDAVAAFIRELAARPAADPATELVINGDMVDFLAERHPGDSPWQPFNADPDTAVRLLHDIVERDRQVFDALSEFLAAGHRLVILLGNHDVELALPQVRAALAGILDATGRDFTFVHDGEAYVVGDALIEHGNEYDHWNRVNFAQLRLLRADLSRGREPDPDLFEAPAGSFMVAEVINPVKEHYKFIDLLKPETSACFPLLLALEPSYRPLLAKLTKNRTKSASISARRSVIGALGGDISSGDPLGDELQSVLGDDAEEFFGAIPQPPAKDISSLGGDISSSGGSSSGSRVWGGLRLLFGRGNDAEAVQSRLPALRGALKAAQGDRSFDRSVEAKKEYWEAAKKLATGPIRHVVFGHTHLPKKVELPSGGFYLNSGTWADVLRFPEEMLEGDDVGERLAAFIAAMQKADFSEFTLFRPTYVRLDVNEEGTVTDADLHDWVEG